MITETIFGEPVTGKVIREYDNIAILEDDDMNRYVIHKKDIGLKPKGNTMGRATAPRFNLEETKNMKKNNSFHKRKLY